MPFDDNKDLPKPRRGVKLNNKDSIAPQPVKTTSKEDFEQNAQAHFTKYEEYKKRTWDLSTKFKSFIEDSVLLENKSPIVKELEKEVLDKLIALASDMNADENQPEGIGSVALCMLMMKCMLIQRDTVNHLRCKTEKLEHQIAGLQNAIQAHINDIAKDK